MTYSRASRIESRGQATAAQIQAWFAARGPNYAGYAPDGKYKPPPADLGAAIVAECQRYPDHVINSDCAAAQILHETAAWQSEYARERNNPGGIGAINSNPDLAIRFPSVADGVRAHVAHLLVYSVGDGAWIDDDPRYGAVKASGWVGIARTWADLEQRWAWSPPDRYYATPVSQRYGAQIANLANDLLQFAAAHPDEKEQPPMSKPLIRVALAAGHHNSDGGGTAGEQSHTGPLTKEIARQLREHGGFDVHVITPRDGLGMFPGDLWDVAETAAALNPALFLEVHFEGTPNPSVRGCFAIYPDAPGDLDKDVRDRLGPDMAMRLQAATGLPVRGDGTMSERDTGVGSGGSRLGIFNKSASVKETCTRLIFEFGALTNPRDKAIINEPGFYGKAAGATVAAIAAFYDVESSQPQQQAPPAGDVRTFPETPDYVIRGGFKGFWEELEIDGTVWRVLGFPQSNEFRAMVDDTERTVQEFQKGYLIWLPENEPPWHIQMALLSEVEQIEGQRAA